MTPTKELLRRDAAYDRWGEAGSGGTEDGTTHAATGLERRVGGVHDGVGGLGGDVALHGLEARSHARTLLRVVISTTERGKTDIPGREIRQTANFYLRRGDTSVQSDTVVILLA